MINAGPPNAFGQRALAVETNASAAEIAAIAADCLRLEVETFPKPGLVSHLDSGSHADMNAATFRRGALAVRPYFRMLAAAGSNGAGMDDLRTIGREAEAAMLAATGGVNTHRGAIFGLGLFCAAAGACEAGRVRPPKLLGTIVALSWGTDILAGSAPDNSHGRDACRRYGAGGARQEAAGGFASVHEIGAPALAAGARLASGDAEAGRVQACFALIAVVEDTNVLHRGGSAGLRFAQAAAQTFLDAGGVGRPGWREHAQAVHRAFVARRLSPGGSADLLAMSLFVRAYEERCLRRAPPH